MGGTVCHYSSSSINNGCSSYPDNSILSAGAIAGIVIGILLGIAIIVLLVVISCKLYKRNNSYPRQPHHSNVYNVPMNMYDQQQSSRRHEKQTSPQPPPYYQTPMNNVFYENR